MYATTAISGIPKPLGVTMTEREIMGKRPTSQSRVVE